MQVLSKAYEQKTSGQRVVLSGYIPPAFIGQVQRVNILSTFRSLWYVYFQSSFR